MTQTIFIIGKADPGLESVRAIHTQGFQVGLFADALHPPKHPEAFDTIVPLHFDTLGQELKKLDDLKESVAGLVCTYENYVIAKATLSSHFNLPGASLASARMSTDKYLMRQAFTKADPRITPRFQQVATQEELLAFAQTTTYPLILKPTNLVKSLLVLRCNNEQELLANFDYAKKSMAALYKKYDIYEREPQLIVEEFIKGKSCSVAAFVDTAGTAHFCDGIVALTTAAEHGTNDNYLYSRALPATNIDSTVTKRIFEVAKIGVEALEMRSTPAHIELMYDGNDVKIIEIGARIGGYRPRMYRYSYSIDLVAQEVNLAIGKQPNLQGTFKEYSAVFELFPETTGKFMRVDMPEDTSVYTSFKVKPQPGQIIGPAKHGFKAAAVIIITHKNKDTFERLCQSVDTFSVEVES